MMPGSTTLGLNSAFTLPGDAGDNPDSPAFGRQPLPAWTEPNRTRPVHEPYQGWVSPFGLLADGPLTIYRQAVWEICYRYYWSESAGCGHLTLAPQCWFNEDFTKLYVPQRLVRDYAHRPYRWQEVAVQAAYETASDGDVTASEIADLADIGKSIPDGQGGYTKIEPTPAQRFRIAEIHGNWTEDAAAFLAFGPGASRPFRWNPGLHADQNMAPAPGGVAGYAIDPDVYSRGTMHEPYPPRPPDYPNTRPHTNSSGQGFMAWRKCRDGALTADDWEEIANAIANGGNEEQNALVRARPLQACDIIVEKEVTLTRTFWRGKTDRKANKTIGKEGRKRYYITCTWISGARPAAFEGTPYSF